jgi:hypothetical protein
MQKYGYSPPAALVAFEPKAENEGGKTSDGQLIGYVHSGGGNGGRKLFFRGWCDYTWDEEAKATPIRGRGFAALRLGLWVLTLVVLAFALSRPEPGTGTWGSRGTDDTRRVSAWLHTILFPFLSPVNSGSFLAGWASQSVGKPAGFKAIPKTSVFPLPTPLYTLTLAVFLLWRIVEWATELGLARDGVIYRWIVTHVVICESAWSSGLFQDGIIIVADVAGRGEGRWKSIVVGEGQWAWRASAGGWR